jgi:cysteinyl-tRNA synthetase
LSGILGILQQDPEHFLKGNADESAEIEALITKRNEARKNKDFKTADQVRDHLLSKGIVLEDTAQGTLWRKS